MAIFDDFTLEDVPAPPPTPTPTPAPTPIFADNFNDNVRDIAKWKFDALNEGAANWDPNVPALEQNSRLEVKPLTNLAGNHFNGYVSLATWDMTNAQASIVVLQTTDPAGLADTVFAIGIDSNDWYRFAVEAGQLYFQSKVAGAKTSTNITFNSVLHSFWRFRHNPDLDQILFETSNDGTNWTVRRTVTRAIPITALHYELSAGTGNAQSNPGFAIFDNFQLIGNLSGPAPSPTPVTSLSDDFNDNDRDIARWKFDALNDGIANWDPSVPVLEQNGRLEITPHANTSGGHYNGYVSVSTWDLTNQQASVDVVQTTDSGGFADTVLAVGNDSNNWYRFVFEHGQLYFQDKINGVKSGASFTGITYSPTQHRFWRIRHDQATDQMFFETSPDRLSWTVQRSLARVIPITALKVELDAGTPQFDGFPGTAIFDDFILAPATGSPTPTPTPSPTPAVLLTDNFNDNVRDVTKWKFDALNEGPANWDANVPALEQNSRLEVKPLANTSGNHFNGYVSLATWDMTNAQASVTVLQTTDAASLADTVFAIGIDNNNWFRFVVEGGQLYFQDKAAGVKTSTNVTYNAALHRYWRFRHDQATDQILFETSNDGLAWAVRRSVARAISITAIRFELSAGTANPQSVPGFAIFDDFALQLVGAATPTPTPTPAGTATPTPTPTPPLLADDFNDNVQNVAKWTIDALNEGHAKWDADHPRPRAEPAARDLAAG